MSGRGKDNTEESDGHLGRAVQDLMWNQNGSLSDLRSAESMSAAERKREIQLGRAIQELRRLKKRGRPRDKKLQEIWAKGADLREKDLKKWSWSKLASTLDPDGWKQKRRPATDRMRLGITSILRQRKNAAKQTPKSS